MGSQAPYDAGRAASEQAAREAAQQSGSNGGSNGAQDQGSGGITEENSTQPNPNVPREAGTRAAYDPDRAAAEQRAREAAIEAAAPPPVVVPVASAAVRSAADLTPADPQGRNLDAFYHGPATDSGAGGPAPTPVSRVDLAAEAREAGEARIPSGLTNPGEDGASADQPSGTYPIPDAAAGGLRNPNASLDREFPTIDPNEDPTKRDDWISMEEWRGNTGPGGQGDLVREGADSETPESPTDVPAADVRLVDLIGDATEESKGAPDGAVGEGILPPKAFAPPEPATSPIENPFGRVPGRADILNPTAPREDEGGTTSPITVPEGLPDLPDRDGDGVPDFRVDLGAEPGIPGFDPPTRQPGIEVPDDLAPPEPGPRIDPDGPTTPPPANEAPPAAAPDADYGDKKDEAPKAELPHETPTHTEPPAAETGTQAEADSHSGGTTVVVELDANGQVPSGALTNGSNQSGGATVGQAPAAAETTDSNTAQGSGEATSSTGVSSDTPTSATSPQATPSEQDTSATETTTDGLLESDVTSGQSGGRTGDEMSPELAALVDSVRGLVGSGFAETTPPGDDSSEASGAIESIQRIVQQIRDAVFFGGSEPSDEDVASQLVCLDPEDLQELEDFASQQEQYEEA